MPGQLHSRATRTHERMHALTPGHPAALPTQVRARLPLWHSRPPAHIFASAFSTRQSCELRILL